MMSRCFGLKKKKLQPNHFIKQTIYDFAKHFFIVKPVFKTSFKKRSGFWVEKN